MILPVVGSTVDPDHDGGVRDGRRLDGNPNGQVEAILAHLRHRVPLCGAPEIQQNRKPFPTSILKQICQNVLGLIHYYC